MKLTLKTVEKWNLKGVVVTAESLLQLEEFAKEITNKDVRLGYQSLVNILKEAYKEI